MSRYLSLTLLALFGLAPQVAGAATFAVLTSVPGGPQIGAIRGDTMYGTIAYDNAGVLFSLTTSGTYKLLHTFDAATDGQNPNARLAIDPSGNIYGTTGSGGANGAGTLWAFSHGTMTTKHAFGSISGDGTNPYQGPSLAPNGSIIDTTSQGAIGGSGNIWALVSGAYQVLYKFQSGGDGHCPFSGVFIDKSGNIYGTTVGVGFGGNPTGSVWKYSASAGLQTLYVFQDEADGEWPDQAPTVDGRGNVYGTTHTQNGQGFPGAIWKIDSLGHFSVLHAFTGADGSAPNSPLVIDGDGRLYGTTSSGGAANYGTVFSITPGGSFSVVHSFAAGSDGAQPTGNLVRGAKDVLYGGTAYGPVFTVTP